MHARQCQIVAAGWLCHAQPLTGTGAVSRHRKKVQKGGWARLKAYLLTGGGVLGVINARVLRGGVAVETNYQYHVITILGNWPLLVNTESVPMMNGIRGCVK